MESLSNRTLQLSPPANSPVPSIDDTVSLLTNLAQQFEESDALRQETDQRFNILLEEARADRQRSDERANANAAEHRAFQQIAQTLLAEINRIGQRLAR